MDQKPALSMVVALLILLLGIAAGISLMGWYAAGIGSNDVNVPGIFAMACGLTAIIILCVALCSVVFDKQPAGQSRREPVTPPKPPTVVAQQRRQEQVGETAAKLAQDDRGDEPPTATR